MGVIESLRRLVMITYLLTGRINCVGDIGVISKVCRVTVAATFGLLLCFAEVAAQHPSKLPRVGVLWPGDVERWNAAFLDTLREHQYIDRKTVVFDIRATGGDLGVGASMAEAVVAGNPDVIFVAPGALAKPVIAAVNKSRQHIPVVVLTWDPVAEGLVDSAARPSGNVTGVAGVWHSPAFMTKHLQLMRDLIPKLSRVFYVSDTVWYPREELLKTREAVEKGGERMGVLVTSFGVQKPEQVDHIFAEAIRNNVNAVIVQASPMFSGQRSPDHCARG